MMWSTTIVATWFALANGILTESTCEDDVALLQHSQTLPVKQKRSGSLESNRQGLDTDCFCNLCSVFGADNPDDVVEMRQMFDSKCQEFYSQLLCTSVADEAFNVLDNSILFSAQKDEHPLFCSQIAELIVVSQQHQSEGRGHAALLKRSLSKTSSGKTLDQSIASKEPLAGPDWAFNDERCDEDMASEGCVFSGFEIPDAYPLWGTDQHRCDATMVASRCWTRSSWDRRGSWTWTE